MAIVKLSALFSDISGTVGNLTFSRTTGGLAVRKKRSQYSDFTDTFYDWSTRMSHFGSQWKLLTERQRIQWNNAAKEVPRSNRVGDQKTISGINYFCSVNTNRYMVGEPQLDVPPVLAVLPYFYTMYLTGASPSSLRFRYIIPPSSRQVKILIKASPPISPGVMRNYNWNQLIIVNAEHLDPNDIPSYKNLKNLYINKYGSLPSGKKVFVKACLIDVLSGRKYSCITTNKIIS